MALIYKITNNITKKSYIGKTTRTLAIRLAEHKRDCKNYTGTTIPLYNAVQQYGWDQFIIEVIEDNILDENIDEKEQQYIILYNTYQDGYNATIGGDGGRTSSKLTEHDALEIISLLKDNTNMLSIIDIAKLYNIDSSVVSNINLGKTWRHNNEVYPLRNFSMAGITLSRDQYKNIIDDILYTQQSLSEIAKKYNLSESKMTSINQGYHCYNNNNPIYKNIYNGSYPIRPSANKKTNLTDQIEFILYDILFTDKSMAKIGEKYNISGNSLQYIQAGQRQKELTSDFIVPLRKNIQANQEIYKQKYKEVMLCATLD